MKKFYLYNFNQIDFFIKNGLTPIGSGYGKNRDAYVVFVRNIKSEEVFGKWCTMDKK